MYSLYNACVRACVRACVCVILIYVLFVWWFVWVYCGEERTEKEWSVIYFSI